jgi:spore coat protein U-like protein
MQMNIQSRHPELDSGSNAPINGIRKPSQDDDNSNASSRPYILTILRYILTTLLLSTCFTSSSHALSLLFSCNFASIGTLNFGTVGSNAAVGSTAVVSVTCTNLLSLGATNISYTVTAGPGGSGNQLARHLTLLTNNISYNAYTNSGYTSIFGDTTGGTADFTLSYSLNALQSRTDNFTVYGLLPAQTLNTLGVYTDSVALTLTY